MQPSSPYSASEASSDILVLSYVRTYGLSALITRSSNNYGPYQFPENFLPLMITNALEHKPLPIYGDGKQQRDWLHVEDICRGVLAVLDKGRVGEVYKISASWWAGVRSGKYRSYYEKYYANRDSSLHAIGPSSS